MSKTPPRLYLSSPHMGDTEQVFVKEAFDTNWVAPLGPNVDGFERDLQEYTGSAHAAALSSGTAALHLSLIMLGVKPGDTVICQSLTFSASANPIAYLGAVPVFIDSEHETWNMCPDALEQAVKDLTSKGKKPKAIIPVHLYGMPARMDEIISIAQHYDIPIVEDAAEALGSSLNGRKCGTFGKLGILSFNGNKIITTSGGGALLSADEALIQKARFLATQARDPAPHYQHSHIGYNYRMSNVLAGIGRGQMQVLPQRIEQRRAIFSFYQELLGGIPGIRFLNEPKGCFSNRWLTTLLIDPQMTGGITREDIRQALEARNIESRPLWKPMHLQPVFEGNPYFGGQVAEKLFEKGLCLPSGSNMTAPEKERIAERMRQIFHLK
ncbi:MAG: aminotransferase class I/II-fold pyridoxal phosphate-dependent enzyme [Bacteroidales bacterium]|nr:aminotransferase class I/II-fold pyridoxal phosphate-dependent enzyme [Bacteroidales bacterium]